MTDVATYQMPTAYDAERLVLCAMMLSDNAVSRVSMILNESHFARASHRHIWNAIMALRERNRPADLTLVGDQLEQSRKLEEVGGHGYLVDIAASGATSANAEYYARIVLDRAIRRKAITQLHAAAVALGALDNDATAWLTKIETDTADLIRSNGTGRSVETIAELAARDLSRIDQNIPDRRVTATNFPYDEEREVAALDILLGGGFAAGELHILGGMASSGKTALCVQMAYTMGYNGGRVAFMPLEGGRDSIIRRLRMQLSGVPIKPRYDIDEREAMRATLSRLAAGKIPFVVDDMHDERPIKADTVRRHIHAMRAEYGTRVVFIDHLSMFDAKPDNVTFEHAEVIRRLVDVAIGEDVAIILLHHLTPAYAAKAAIQPTVPTLEDFQLARHALEKYPYGVHALTNPHAGVTIAASKIQEFKRREGNEWATYAQSVDWGEGKDRDGNDKPKMARWSCLKLKEGENGSAVNFQWVPGATAFNPWIWQ